MANAANTDQDMHMTKELDIKRKALQEKLGKLQIPFRWRDGTLEMRELKYND